MQPNHPARSALAGQGVPPVQTREKVYCHAIPAIVGPRQGKIRAWHQSAAGLPFDQIFAARAGGRHGFAQPGAGTGVTIARLRMALRRERQLGRCGDTAYSIERHGKLSRTLRECLAAMPAGQPGSRLH